MTEASNLSLEQRAMQGATMTPEERKKMWLSISDISEAQFNACRWNRKRAKSRSRNPARSPPISRSTSSRGNGSPPARGFDSPRCADSPSASSSAPILDRRFVIGPCA